MPDHRLLQDPFDRKNELTPKTQECVWNKAHIYEGRPKDGAFFEQAMAKCFKEGRRILRDDGIASVVFAHQTTEGWEALLGGLINGGLTVTGSWPIATEMASRVRARDNASLATSVHLICRPRPENAPVGDWGEVLRELPKRVGDWMERLQAEGVRGADLVFACIGPALEIYSRYSKVVDPDEKEIPLGGNPEAKEPHKRGFLAYVWETVGRIALGQVLGTAEAQARNGMAEALEEDARLTALFLWTLQSTNGQNGAGLPAEASAQRSGKPDEESEEESSDTDDGETAPKGKINGYSLVFDVVRRFAQPLGIELPKWEGRIIETKKGIVRLMTVSERTKQLFGDDGADAVADLIERDPVKNLQQVLFPEFEEEQAPKIRGRGRGRRKVSLDPSVVEGDAIREATTLDRVHAAMLLQAGGQSNALRALIKAEQERGPDFLRLANALSALYPKKSEEKRLLDAMLLAVQR
jgi:putative DNA methylase